MRIDRENYDNIKSSISMKNLKKIALNRGYTLVKIAMEAKISESTVNAYINGQKIPSLVTLISIADYLKCNIDYLLDRTDNPICLEDIEKINKNPEINNLMNNILSLSDSELKLVIGYVKGILANK